MKLKISHIKSKFILAILMIVIFSIAAFSFAIYIYVNDILSRQVVKDNGEIVNNLARQLSDNMVDIRKYSMSIILNDQIQDYLKQKDDYRSFEYFSNIRNLANTLREYTLLRDNIIDSIYIIDNTGNTLELGKLYSDMAKNIGYDDFYNSKENIAFSGVYMQSTGNYLTGEKIVSYMEKIYDKYGTNVYLGTIVINLKYDYLTRLFNSNNSSIKALFITDGRNIPFYRNNSLGAGIEEDLASVLKDRKPVVKEEKGYFITRNISLSNWTVVGILPYQSIYEDLRYVNLFFLIVGIACLIIMSVIIFPVVKGITKPLMSLVRGMKEVSQGKLNTRIEIHSGDEIEELSNVFNKMVGDIKQHIDELLQRERREHEMELKILMSQINPHFIYNTLSTIIYQARNINAQEIITTTRNFIRILQNTIKTNPYEVTTIQKEIEFIKSYISILRCRYNNLVDVIFNIDKGLLNAKILRMLIYPLVENSVFHGIFPGAEKGIIRIGISRENEKLKVEVEDEGKGMSAVTLENLKHSIDECSGSENNDHIGLYNVNSRLRLLYGMEYCLHISSRQGKGTHICFYIPFCTE